MSKYQYQILALKENLTACAGEEMSRAILVGSEMLSDTANPEKIAHWVGEAIARLEEMADGDTCREVMNRCGRNCAAHNMSPINRALARRKKYPTEDAFLLAEQKNPPAGMRFERQGNTITQFYTPHAFTHAMRCFCSLLNALPEGETVSLTYCQCSRGFVQKYWETVLDRPVEVDLLASAVSGADECKFSVRL